MDRDCVHAIVAEAEAISADFYQDRIESERLEGKYSATSAPAHMTAEDAAWLFRSHKRALTRMAGHAMLTATMVAKGHEPHG